MHFYLVYAIYHVHSNATMEEQPEQGYSLGREWHGKPTYAVTGAETSMSAGSHTVIFHLFVDFVPPPIYSLHNEETFALIKNVPHHDGVREMQATLVMSPEAAKVLAAQINEIADEALRRRGGHSDG